LCITTEWTPDDEYGSKVRITALQKQEPIQLKRAGGVAARSPVRLDFELLREATALTAIRDLEETLHHALNTSPDAIESAFNEWGTDHYVITSKEVMITLTGVAARVARIVPRHV
jgi:hypothetical protein